MIALAKVKETERLLATTELSQRKIAARVGISRATVAAIASGKHRDYEARLIARMEESQPLGPLARCAGCGGMVYMPCRLCKIRALKDRERQVLRAGRRAARELAVRRLLEAVRRAYWAREAAERARQP
jgi:transcriptional regulator with XRE-family HTH domain